jgi:hypothetical protein
MVSSKPAHPLIQIEGKLAVKLIALHGSVSV